MLSQLPMLFSIIVGALLSLSITGGEAYYTRPLGAVSPGDIRRPGKRSGNAVSGFYTKVSPKDKWPDSEVPWEYDSANTFTDNEKAIIEAAMQQITTEACVDFIPKTTQTAYISFKNSEEGCWAELGFQNKKQEINMDPDCFEDTTTAIHEIMHALGFEHEQTRYDRDLYVDIQWDNIKKGEEHNFEKHPRTYAYPLFEFDFMSLMMYTLDSFGENGRPSMLVVRNPKKIDENEIGRAKNMTDSDQWRIASAYQCAQENNEEEVDEEAARTSHVRRQFTNFF